MASLWTERKEFFWIRVCFYSMLVLITVFYGPVTMKKAFKLALAFVLSILLLHAIYSSLGSNLNFLSHSKKNLKVLKKIFKRFMVGTNNKWKISVNQPTSAITYISQDSQKKSFPKVFSQADFSICVQRMIFSYEILPMSLETLVAGYLQGTDPCVIMAKELFSIYFFNDVGSYSPKFVPNTICMENLLLFSGKTEMKLHYKKSQPEPQFFLNFEKTGSTQWHQTMYLLI